MVNKVLLIGRLGHSPKQQTLNNGQFVCRFSIATSEKWKDKDGDSREQTEWHNIVAWGKLGEVCAEYLSKGKLVYIEGKLQTREWEDREGNKKRTTEVVASEMRMLDKRESATEQPEAINISDEDIPF